MTGFWGEMRASVRSMVRRPAFTALSVLTLGVGIGSATAVFSLAEAVLLRPLPLQDGDRLVRVYSTNPVQGYDRYSVSYPDFADWTGRTDIFSAASLYVSTARDLAGDAEPVRLQGVVAFDDFFATVRTRAVVGRLLTADDQDPANEAAIVLSQDVWTRVFGADPGLVGRTVRLDGKAYTVVGVTPHGATWPLDADFWVPAQIAGSLAARLGSRTNHAYQVVARLEPGVKVGNAEAQAAAMARAWYEANATGSELGTEALVVPLRSSVIGDAGPVLFGVMGAAVLLVLLIACINQSNLLLTRALTRSQELSLRSALGAGRTRTVLVLLGESTLLALVGGLLGLALAAAAVKGVVAGAPLDLPTLADVRLNGTVLLGALVFALTSSLLAGLVPAVRASRTSMADALRDGATHASQGRSGARLRKGLVVAELTLSVVLLSASGLSIRTFQAQLAADPGFDAENALVFSLRLPSSRYGTPVEAQAFYDEAVRRLQAIPGVRLAGITSNLPLGATGGSLTRVFLLEGQPEPPATSDVAARWITAGPSYLQTLGVQPLGGRVFDGDDTQDAPPVMIVSESFARRISPDQEILGRRIRSWRDENLLREVVGVVPDVQLGELAGPVQPTVWVPAAQDTRATASFLVRTTDGAGELAGAVRSVMTGLDGDVALAGLRTLEAAHREGLAGVRLVMTLFGLFGVLALGLAVVGVYGLVAYSVSQRTREIGIRVAMGATGASVQGRVLGEGVVLAVLGLSLGLAISLALARVARSVFFGLDWLDPLTFVGVAAVLGGATLAASWVPARRALRVDPVESLKGA